MCVLSPVMDIDSEILILQVQENSCVYDPQCKDYKNRIAKIEAWTNICCHLFGETWNEFSDEEKQKMGKEVQKRWKSLKDAYTRSLKAREEKMASGKTSCRPYVYENQMSFLKTFLENRGTLGNMVSDIHNKSEVEEYLEVVEASTGTVSEINLPVIPAKKSRRQNDRFDDRSLDITKRSPPSALTNNTSIIQQPHNEEDKMFLLSLLPMMNKMTDLQRIDFKIKVMTLLKESVEQREEKTPYNT